MLNLLEKIAQEPESSQILMTTHDPLVIGGLTKEEIRIFHAQIEKDENGEEFNRISTFQPDFDPRGLGVAGILTSEFFNLPSAMDEETFLDLSRKRELEVLKRDNKLTVAQTKEYDELLVSLSKVGFDKVQRDPLYDRFIQAVYRNPDLKRAPANKEEREKQDNMMAELIKDIMDEEKES